MLCEKGATVNVGSGVRSLHDAVESKNCVKVVETLLKSKRIRVNVLNKSGWTALYTAMKWSPQPRKLAELLIKAGADVNIQGKNGETPLQRATKFSNVTVAEFLLTVPGIDLHVRNRQGETALDIAIQYVNCVVVERILAKAQMNDDEKQPIRERLVSRLIKVQEHTGSITFMYCDAYTDRTIFHFCAQFNLIELMKHILRIPAKVPVGVRDRESNTPLHLAVQAGHLEMVQLLLEQGASTEDRNENNQTPRCLAAFNDNQEKMKLLLEQSNSTGVRHEKHETPLHGGVLFYDEKNSAVMQDDHLHRMETILKNTRIDDDIGKTLSTEREELSKNLISFWIKVDEDTRAITSVRRELNAARTIFHICAQFNLMELMKRVLKVHNKLSVRDSESNSPLHLAVKAGHLRMVQYLIENGAVISDRDYNNDSSLDLAVKYGFEEIAKLLRKVQEEQESKKHTQQENAPCEKEKKQYVHGF